VARRGRVFHGSAGHNNSEQAVPVISQALDVAPLSMKSVLASYTLSLAVFIPISGWMADRFGTRRVFASAIGLFTLGSVLCGISSDIHLLVASRVLQGCGGAMMVPVGRLTLVRTFDKSELIRAMSFVAIPGLIGPMLGPIAGGLIVGYLQWRFIFFVNLPVGIAGLFLVYLHLPDYREENTKPLDIVGLILFGSGVALLSYVLEIFGEHALSLGESLGLLSISLALIAGYGMHATKTASPLLDLNLFRIRTFNAAVSGSFFTRLGIGGVPFLLPLLYQVGLGFTPVQSGLLIMPQAIAAMSTKFLMTKILGRVGFRGVLISNTIVLGHCDCFTADSELFANTWNSLRRPVPRRQTRSCQLIAEQGPRDQGVQHPASCKQNNGLHRAGPTSTKARPIRSCGRGAATGGAAPPRAAGHFNGMRAQYEASASYGQLARARRANGTPRSLVNTNGEMGSCSLLKRRSACSSRARDRGGPRSSRSSPATHAAVRGAKSTAP
jgi:MFS family permease